MTREEQFCILNGIEFSTKINSFECPYCGSKSFTDAKIILEVMMKREDWDKFSWLWQHETLILIPLDYILNPDKLLDEAIRFCEKCHE